MRQWWFLPVQSFPSLLKIFLRETTISIGEIVDGVNADRALITRGEAKRLLCHIC